MRWLEDALSDGLGRLVHAVERRPRPVALALLGLTAVLGVYAVLNLGINSDNTRMVAADVPSMQAQRRFSELFPTLDNALIVVIDGATPQRTREAADLLAERLASDHENFVRVFEPGGGSFFERNGLLYRSVEEVESFADDLVVAQPMLAELERDDSVANLAALIRLGLDESRDGPAIAVPWPDVLDRVGDAAVAVYAEYPVFVSWEDLLLRGSALEVDPRRVLMVEPVLDFDSLLPAGPAMAAIHRAAADLVSEEGGGLRVRITGNPALNYEEMLGLAWDIGIAGVFCFLLVAAVIYRALRSVPLVLAALVTLLSGLLWTAAFAAAAVGQLNIVSICFAILFIGLGVDFSIHLGMQYAALRCDGVDHLEALERSARVVGSSLVLCAVTTAIGFLVFVPTDYRGVAELGLISGVGMFVMLIMNLTLFPALLSSWFRVDPASIPRSSLTFHSHWLSLPERHPGGVIALAAALAVAGLLIAPSARFDVNVVDMRDPSTESVQAFADLLADNDLRSPWFANVLAPDLGSADALAERFRALEDVGLVVTLSDFVPKDQEEKRAILEDLALILDTPSGDPPAERERPDTTEQIAALAELRDFLAARSGPDGSTDGSGHAPLRASMRKLQEQLTALLDRIESDGDADRALANFEKILLGELPEQLARLRRALDPDVVTLETLPEELTRRMRAPDGRSRIQVFPAENLSREEALDRFVAEVEALAPNATGMAVNLVEFGRVTVESLTQAIASAVVAIFLLLLLLWRRIGPTLLVLTPLALGAVLLVASMVAFGIPFNFANVIVVPLLLGMGVDSGIHLVHRSRMEGLGSTDLMESTTARAVIFSALTTVVSFGSLALSSHRGMMSLGQVLVIGMFFMLFANLVVLPALLVWTSGRGRVADDG